MLFQVLHFFLSKVVAFDISGWISGIDYPNNNTLVFRNRFDILDHCFFILRWKVVVFVCSVLKILLFLYYLSQSSSLIWIYFVFLIYCLIIFVIVLLKFSTGVESHILWKWGKSSTLESKYRTMIISDSFSKDVLLTLLFLEETIESHLEYHFSIWILSMNIVLFQVRPLPVKPWILFLIVS